jgi:carboxyl-terminal processing protease
MLLSLSIAYLAGDVVKKEFLASLWAATLVLIAGLLGGLLGTHILATPKTSPPEVSKLLRTYAEVLSLAEENYADEIDTEKTLYDSIRGMLQTLDPHSSFFDSNTYRQFRDDQRGNFYGLGISVGTVDGQPTVIATLPGTPAQRLGIRSGDIIVRIDGRIGIGLSRQQVVDRLRGPRGTTVRVSVQREGVTDLLEFSVTRDVIPQHSVPLAFYLRPKIGYIRIDNFTETTEQEIESSLKTLGPELENLLLDLRGNPGGSLQAAIGVADKFLRKGQAVLVTKGRLASANQSYVVPNGTAGGAYAMVVLINSDSASASEIVAGAVQDHDRGLIAGETSFGKGLVQSVFDLSRGAGVALTTAKWYTPSGRLIQRDYRKKSFYDYFNGKGKEIHSSTEIKRTDSGRAVYGGGGITPDVILEPQSFSSFQSLLLTNATCFSFIRSYNARYPGGARSFEVTDKLLQEFKSHLDTKQVVYQEPEFHENVEFLKRQLRYEYILARTGFEEAQKVALEGDTQVLKAIDLLPQARALFAKTERIVASKRNPAESH